VQSETTSLWRWPNNSRGGKPPLWRECMVDHYLGTCMIGLEDHRQPALAGIPGSFGRVGLGVWALQRWPGWLTRLSNDLLQRARMQDLSKELGGRSLYNFREAW
jgi:hypothetical protein